MAGGNEMLCNENGIAQVRTTLNSDKCLDGFVFNEEDYYKLCECDEWSEEKIQEKVEELNMVLEELDFTGDEKDFWIMKLGHRIRKTLAKSIGY
jgi:hypothetical protein